MESSYINYQRGEHLVSSKPNFLNRNTTFPCYFSNQDCERDRPRRESYTRCGHEVGFDGSRYGCHGHTLREGDSCKTWYRWMCKQESTRY